MKSNRDYSLYLITDRTALSHQPLEQAVEAAIQGGCTMVQLREKDASDDDFLATAHTIKQVTDRYGIPLLINDRVDIALQVDAAGVHVGQGDAPAHQARQAMGGNKILGVSAANLTQAMAAAAQGADYLGIGAMFATQTKPDACLTSLGELYRIRTHIDLPLVAIGGINQSTLPLFYGSGIDGVAVASAILGSRDIAQAARALKGLFRPQGDVRAVIFDLDGTLLDSMDLWANIDRDFLGKRGLLIPDDYVDEVCARTFREAAEYTIQRFGLKETPTDIMAEWHDMAVHEYSHNIRLKPHAKAYLQHLKNSGVKLGVATSSTPSLFEPVLNNNGIRQLFDVVCCAEEVGSGKASPDLFLYTADKLEESPQHCLVFEDILQAVRSAKEAGMTVYTVYDPAAAADWEQMRQLAHGAILGFDQAPMLRPKGGA